jgi:hypothetical protein
LLVLSVCWAFVRLQRSVRNLIRVSSIRLYTKRQLKSYKLELRHRILLPVGLEQLL